MSASSADRLDREARRALRSPDPNIDSLGARDRRAVGAVWVGRADGERQAAGSFAVIERDLRSLGAAPELLALCIRAVDDERRHADLCRRLAERYLGREVPAKPARPPRVPAHAGADPRLIPTLHVLGMCAINETTACAFLERGLAEARVPLVRAAFRELLADEIDHARLGWAHLETLTPSERAAVSPWLAPMLEANFETWLGGRSEEWPGPGLTEHGCLPPAVVGEAVLAAAVDLILPGFERAGVDVEAARLSVAARTRPGTP